MRCRTKPAMDFSKRLISGIFRRSRLIKINKKESPKTASCVRERRASSEVNVRRCKSKCEKTQADADAAIEGKIAGWRLKKPVENVAKKTRRVPKRITATHNFVYEFNPFGNPTTTPGNATKTKEVQNLSNIGLEEPFYKSTNSKQNFSNTRPRVTSVLPKLNPHSDSLIGNSERHENMTNPKKNASLATIKKQETGVEQRLIKPRAERQKLISEIDREVERVKSDWRTLRSSAGWTQSKNFANARTRKLYDSLEKMTQEMDKMQKSYMDPKSNRYLHRGAMKALDPADRLSFEEKASKIKNMLFPKDNKKVVDETLNELSNVLKTNLSDVTLSEPNKKIEKKSLLPNTQSQNGKNNSPSNVHKRNTSGNNGKSLKKINSDIERYLHNYINEAEKNFVNKEEPKIKELEIHSEDVSDMLKKLNLNSFDIYDIARDSEENPLLQSVERTKSSAQITIEPKMTEEDVAKILSRMQSSVQTSIDSKVESAEIKKEEIAKILSLKEDGHSTKYNMLNYDTSIQTNTKNIPQNNAFIEMGVHALSNNYPQNALMRVLQSEYLKKDTTLKPM